MRRKYYFAIMVALMLALAGCGSDKRDNQKEQENITTEAGQKDQDNVTTEHGQAQAKDEKLTLEYVCEEFNIDESEFVERFLELSLFYGLSSPLNSEMICIFPYF